MESTSKNSTLNNQRDSWKATVELATTHPINGAQYSRELNGTITGDGQLFIDGVLVNVGYRILVKDQEDKRQNGIYIVEVHGSQPDAPCHYDYLLRRSDDMCQSPILSGSIVSVKHGNANAYAVFMLKGILYSSGDDQILVLNRDPLEWTRINPKSNISIVGTKDRLTVEKTETPTESVYKLDVDPYLTRDIAKVVQFIDNTTVVDPSGNIRQLTLEPDILVAQQANDQKSLSMDHTMHFGNTNVGNLQTNTIVKLTPEKVGQTHLFANVNTTGDWNKLFVVDCGPSGVMSASGVAARYINLRPGGSVLVFWNGTQWQMLNNSCTFSN
jgi:hypothetical protein